MDISRFLQAARQGCVDPYRASCYWKDSPSPPPAPDYTGAATATSQGSVQAAIANNLLNMRNTSTPLGSQTFTPSGKFTIPEIGGQPGFDIPQFKQTISMTPEGQNLYNQQMGLSTGLLGVGQNALDRVSNEFGHGFNTSGYAPIPEVSDAARTNAEDKAYGAATSRLDPQWAQSRQMLDAKLADQGIPVGSEAHANAMREFNQAKNDAYGQARAAAVGQGLTNQQAQFNMGLGANQQGFQETAYQRNLPLTELNAIRTGAQPQMPQFQAVPSAGGAQGPNMLGATQAQYGAGLDQYNAQVGSNNAMMSGLFSLGGALAGPAFGVGGFLR